MWRETERIECALDYQHEEKHDSEMVFITASSAMMMSLKRNGATA